MRSRSRRLGAASSCAASVPRRLRVHRAVRRAAWLHQFRACAEAGGDQRGLAAWLANIFSDWRGNETEFPRELAEFQLAHVVPGAAGDYQREAAPGRRVKLMEGYAGIALDDRASVIAFPTVARA